MKGKERQYLYEYTLDLKIKLILLDLLQQNYLVI